MVVAKTAMGVVTGRENARAEAIAKAGEAGARKLLADRAREIVEKLHSPEGRRMTMEEHERLRAEIKTVLGDRDADSLKMVESDAVTLICRDPYELGQLHNLYDALVDCKNYLKSMIVTSSTTIRSETGMADIWGGTGSM
jgi:hypothetical protein